MTSRDWTLLTILSILWGGSFFFVELALTGLPVLSIVWFRVAGAALLLMLWIAARGQGFPKGAGVWQTLAVQGLLNNVAPFTLLVLAQDQIEGALAAIVNATTPLWTVLVAHAFTADERLTPAKGLAVGLGFGGVLVMTGAGQGAGLGGSALAILACLGAALSYALAGVWGRRFKALGLVPEQIAFGQVSCAAMLLLPVWLIIDRPWALGAVPLPSVAAMAGLIALSTALAYLIFFALLASAGATMLSLVTFLIPPVAMALGIGFLGEHLLPRHLVGFGLIMVALVTMDGRVWKWARG